MARQSDKPPRNPSFGIVEPPQDHRTPARRGASFGVIAGIVSLLIIAFARAFLFQTFRIPSTSMSPTLEAGDHIVVNRAIFGIPYLSSGKDRWRYRLPKRQDVIVFHRFSEFEDLDNHTHYIKRVSGVPGDTIEVKEYRAYVNGEAQGRDDQLFVSPENKLDNDVGRNFGPIVLGPDEYFVLGDNQSNSRDSRFYGPINIADVEGLAEIVYWSWSQQSAASTVRWDRLGRLIR